MRFICCSPRRQALSPVCTAPCSGMSMVLAIKKDSLWKSISFEERFVRKKPMLERFIVLLFLCGEVRSSHKYFFKEIKSLA
jgi:hypothetical protein